MRGCHLWAPLRWLAFSGYGANKSYYVTIAELGGMGDKAYHSQLRVEGFVQPGSIDQNGTHVTFVLNEFESHSPKAATGRAAEGQLQGRRAAAGHLQGRSQALAEGSYGRDGVFHATVLQAKCASKYAPQGPNQPGGRRQRRPAKSPSRPRRAAAQRQTGCLG